jgi:uncharacterized membrane protein YgcG
MVSLRRLSRHVFAPPGAVRRRFSPAVLAAIEQAIAASEARHGGELRFAVEGSLDLLPLWRGQTPRDRAMEVFSWLKVWDTAANNGVLIYVLLADHAVEIIADRGLKDSAAPEWLAACRAMEEGFAKGDYEQGAVAGIATVGQLIARHFPAVDRDEQSNTPVLL